TIIDYNSSIFLEWGAETRTKTREQRDLLGYNVYYDGVFVAFVTETYFEFIGPFAAGDYYFEVTAVYEEGESEPATVVATVVLNPPENLTATTQGNDILLTWELPSRGRGISEYKVYRDQVYIASTTDTLYLDENIPTGNYTYGVLTVFDGGYESEITEVTIEHTDASNNLIPTVTELISIYPNPFNPETTISFSIVNNSSFVNLSVYNIKGQKVRTLFNKEINPGYHKVIWKGRDDNGKHVASGVYFSIFDVKDSDKDYTSVKKVILLK
ncbi:MAG: T9SS type A sorting domain-containing protein, partial [Candidatus Cloacimonetes bacterium]|nr:T9SS type A sorting domain-containing protein [Candidatus Cloacimonadota bacterium]